LIDFDEALIALLGKDAGGHSATTIGRLKEACWEEHARWIKRDLCASIQRPRRGTLGAHPSGICFLWGA
jgi:hypothetical protein